jgi:hypothetical protein
MVFYKKKEKNLTRKDSLECGDKYSLTAIKPDTRLLISHCDGGRTAEDAIELFKDIEKKRDPNTPMPVIVFAGPELTPRADPILTPSDN